MPRRRIRTISLPRRLDPRRARGNATDAQRPPRRGPRGQSERISERRVLALELRKAGGSYREIARQLGVDVHTAHADVGAELAALRETAVAEATELRALELERLDGMTSGLWPHIQEGSAAAVSAGVRVSERRSRLLGLDAPVVTKSELTGGLGVYAEKLAGERKLFEKLDVAQLEELAAANQALLDRALEMVRANATPMLVDGSPSPAAGVAAVSGEPADQSPDSAVTDRPGAGAASVPERTPRGTP